ncbi:MAG: hypothetical protein ACR2OM_05955, partial [Aestuariivirgaceae bacterium]
IEKAVLETDKGRWFLNEFGRRNRVADTQTLLNALSRLERNLTAQPVIQDRDYNEISALARAIDATCTDITSVRNDMLKDGVEIPAGTPVFTHLSDSARKIATDLIATAEALQTSVNGLRASSPDASQVDAIDGHVHTLFDGGWRQDVLAQRISKAMGLLEHLDQNLKTISGQQAAAPDKAGNRKAIGTSASPELSEDNLKFFSGDNELFAQQKPKTSTATEPALELVSETKAPATSSEPSADSTPVDDEAEATGDQANSSAEEPKPAAAEFVTTSVKPKVVIIREGRGADKNDPDEDTSATVEQSAPQSTPQADDKDVDIQVTEKSADAEPAAADSIVEMSRQIEPAETNREDTSDNAEGADKPNDETAAIAANSILRKTQNDALDAFADVAATMAQANVVPEISGKPEVNVASKASGKPQDDTQDEDSERIVVIRHTSSDDSEIPFADYLGIDMPAETETASEKAT